MSVLKKQFSRRVDELLLLVIGSLVLSMVLAVIINVFVRGDGKPVILVGAFIAFCFFITIHFIVVVFSFLNEFNLAVTMNQTRKSFVGGYVQYTVIEIAIFFLSLYLMHLLEKGAYSLIFPGIEHNVELMTVFRPQIVGAIVPAVLVMEMFSAALMLRFGQKAFWAVWIVWMVVVNSIGKIHDVIESSPVLQKIMDFVVTHIPLMYGIGVVVLIVFAVITWNILKKQEAKLY